ncbi:MAG TPA: sigma 54-interacting transcriptional regulator [Pseudomonadales bacterium]|jgi:transcriptional regulator with GAF, ATPase, and Fis domain/tetratricopeptide (TPR) repeat protein|nr:sigma 54-interacting transcriptional regulator [Pseudomonadales bacterium]
MNENNEIDILTLTALFRSEFSIDWMQELTGLKASKILLALDQGVKQSWITRQTPDLYTFSDTSKQRELANGLTDSKKGHWHGRIANLLEPQVETGSCVLRELAHHQLGTTPDLASCQALVQTGDSLYRAFQHQDALQCFTQAIDQLQSMRGDEADGLFVEAVYLYCRIFTGDQEYDWIMAAIDAALVRAERLGFHPKRPLLIMHMAKYKWFSGHHATAIKTFDQGWRMAEADGNPLVLRQALTLRMFFLWWQGRFRELVDVYEDDRPELIRYPRSKTPILTSCMLGASYVRCGQVTHGVGLLTALQDQCRKLAERSSMAEVCCGLGGAFVDIGRTDEAIGILESTLAEKRADLTPFTESSIHTHLARACGEKEDYARAFRELKISMQIKSNSSGMTLATSCSALWLLVLSVDDGELLSATGIDLEKTIDASINGRSIHEKGMAYLVKALCLQRDGAPLPEVAEVLGTSVRWIEESGDVIHLSRIRLVLARVYLLMEDVSRARDIALQATERLAPINHALIPNDLTALIEDVPVQVNLLDAIMKLGNEIVGIRDYRELVQRILSTINQITGAERGALFTIKGGQHEPRPELAAATVLTKEDVEHGSFRPAMTLIRKTISSGENQLAVMAEPVTRTDLLGDRIKRIRSCFCIPMVLRNELIGVLYHDNRLMASHINESDLASLSYFAGQAAIAIDNARAYEAIHDLNQQLMKEKDYYVAQHLQSVQYDDFVGVSPAIRHTFSQVDQVAATDSTVLIMGETGVGKELVARVIHQSSTRKSGPFISVDCSSLSESLINSEMFGHERGAFTGAIKQHTGRFELADGGTLFLDEIGNIPMDVQTRLLRVLETREFQKVGGTETIRSDFRLLTATNEDLTELVRVGKFREDLFYRLNVYPITVPPLRDRIEDVPLLAHFCLKNLGARGGKTVNKIAESTMDKLVQYNWPGNVRELKNVIERGVLLSAGPYLKVPELADALSSRRSSDLTLAEVERQHIMEMLNITNGKIHGTGGAAERLGIHHNTLRSRMKKLGIVRNAQARRFVQSG